MKNINHASKDELVKSIPAGKNNYGWTRQELRKSNGGYYLVMVVDNLKQCTFDYTTVIHISEDYANEFLQNSFNRLGY